MSVLDVDGVEVEVTDHARVAIAPGDVLVVRCPDHITRDQADMLKHHIQNVWPDNRCVVLVGDLSLSVLTPADATQANT